MIIMASAHFKATDPGQRRVLAELFSLYADVYPEGRAAFELTREALLALGWDAAESAEGARQAETDEGHARDRSEIKTVKIESELL
jgi:hypothetical protein